MTLQYELILNKQTNDNHSHLTSEKIYMDINKTQSHTLSNKQELSKNVSIDKLQTIVMFLTTKYAQTKDVM